MTLVGTDCLATRQVGDRLVYQTRNLYVEVGASEQGEPADRSSPLEWYFSLGHERPPFDFWSTGHWRGYEATWKLDNDQLYLIGIKAWVNEHPVRLDEINPAWKGSVKATWFSGTLVTDDYPVNQSQLIIHVRNGDVLQFGSLERAQTVPEERSRSVLPK